MDREEIFVICVDDVQDLALKKLGRKLTEDELYRVKSGIESGLDCWEEVIINSIDELKVEKQG